MITIIWGLIKLLGPAILALGALGLVWLRGYNTAKNESLKGSLNAESDRRKVTEALRDLDDDSLNRVFSKYAEDADSGK